MKSADANIQSENLLEVAATLFSTTALEIAQSARHELQNIEAEQALLLDELSATTRNMKEKGVVEITAKLGDTLVKLSAAISKLRYSGIDAAPKLEKTSALIVWEDSIELLKERLNLMGIKSRYVGPALEGYYYPDWLREAFMNLLLNSIDAFRERPKRNRTISMLVQKESPNSQFHVIDYSDNAGGIAFDALSIPDPVREANPGMAPEQLLFQPKVSSKKNRKGSGWGLYLVRQALRLHDGSVDLRANTGEGCVFRLRLQKNLQSR